MPQTLLDNMFVDNSFPDYGISFNAAPTSSNSGGAGVDSVPPLSKAASQHLAPPLDHERPKWWNENAMLKFKGHIDFFALEERKFCELSLAQCLA